MKEEYDCPCKKVDPDNFLTNQEVLKLLKNAKSYSFKQEDYYKLYNCIQCGACGTQTERILLKQKFLKDGNKIEGLNSTIEALKIYGTPFTKNKSRVKLPERIPKDSETLLYFGCYSAVKTPKYAENITKYLLKKNIDFTIINQEICCGYPILCTGEVNTYELLVKQNKEYFTEKGFKKIITICPSCYMVFKKHYSELGIEIKYFTEYLTPSKEKKRGNLVIQHACPLKNIEIPEIDKSINKIYTKSGYTILDLPHSCCGGGVGHQLRVDIVEKIAIDRMDELKELEDSFLNDGSEGFITTYCPEAFWILNFYAKKKKWKFKLIDPCQLLM